MIGLRLLSLVTTALLLTLPGSASGLAALEDPAGAATAHRTATRPATAHRTATRPAARRRTATKPAPRRRAATKPAARRRAATRAAKRRPVAPRKQRAAKRKRRPRCLRRDVIEPLRYVHGGQVWIPREVACGGRADVIILLHGNQTNQVKAPSVGGGRHLERVARSLIRAGRVRPVILAEPVHFEVCGNGGRLFGAGFSFTKYKRLLYRLLRTRRIRPRSFAVLGHSGAGCCTGAGVFKAAKQIRPLKLLVTSDTCYQFSTYAERLRKVLRRGTVYLNFSRDEPHQTRYRTFERELLTKKSRRFKRCPRSVYRRCLKHPRRPWYSYTTRGGRAGNHHNMPRLSLKTMLRRFYGRGRPTGSARRARRTPTKAADFVGPPLPPG